MLRKMPIFEYCCCCQLRTGVLCIAVTLLILSACLIAIGGLMLSNDDLGLLLEKIWKGLYELHDTIKVPADDNTTIIGPPSLNLDDRSVMFIEWGIIALILVFAFCSLAHFILVIAAAKEVTVLMIPWIIVHWLSTLSLVAFFGVILWKLLEWQQVARYWWILMFLVGVIILMVLAFFVVLSLYQDIVERDNPQYYMTEGTELMHRHMWSPHRSVYYYD